MHYSRLCALLVDCKTSDVDEAARFWAQALGRPVDPNHPGSRGNYRMLETPPDEPIVQVQRVDHADSARRMLELARADAQGRVIPADNKPGSHDLAAGMQAEQAQKNVRSAKSMLATSELGYAHKIMLIRGDRQQPGAALCKTCPGLTAGSVGREPQRGA